MPLFQSIVDTIAQPFYPKQQKKESELDESYNENRCYLGTSGVGMSALVKQHLMFHPCFYSYTDITEFLPNGVNFNQYNLDPLAYRSEWRDDTIKIIALMIKDYLRVNITEKEIASLCQVHNNMLDLLKEIEHSAYFLAKGKMTVITDAMRNALFAYQQNLKIEKDSGKQYNYYVPSKILSAYEKTHGVEFLSRMAILVYSLMNEKALIVVDCSTWGGTEMLPVWGDRHIKQWIISSDMERVIGMDTVYLFKLHYYFDTGKYSIVEEHLEKDSHLMNLRKKKEYQMMSLYDKMRLLSINEYIKIKYINESE